MDNLIVMKLGGSVLTKKEDSEPKINFDNLRRLAKEIAEAKAEKEFRLVVVHGAGPFGHIYAKKYDLHQWLRSKKQVEGIGITHRMMEELNFNVVRELQENGVKAMPFQPSAGGILCNGLLVQFPLNVVEQFVNMKLTVVSHGDVLLDNHTRIGILSGDHLAPYLAQNLNAKRLIFGADVDGVFSDDPKEDPDAKLIKEITPKTVTNFAKGIKGSLFTDVTGGMSRKIKELILLAEQGIESEVVNASKPGIIKKVLLGEKGLGTIIKGD